MQFAWFDYVAFIAFLVIVVSVSLYMSRKEETSEDYFLAGRGLSWWLIGFSLIASNISTEHFVGMAGRGYDVGLAIASFEWLAAVTLVLVAIFFLPRFLKAGIYTMPEFLEYRFNSSTRGIMAVYMMIAYVVVALASVLYAGAVALVELFPIFTLTQAVWLIGAIAGLYTVYGGLKAVIWSDLIQGIALLLGGVLVTVLGFEAMGGFGEFLNAAEGKLDVVLPADHPELPWVAIFGGLWVANFFYWGLNQFITQRTLGAETLAQGQNGIFLAAGIKLLIPFIIVFPGIMAADLFPEQVEMADQAYPVMIENILPVGLTGIMFAALMGALMSSADSMLNSAATIFTVDIYQELWDDSRASHHYVTVGRIATATFALLACFIAPMIEQAGQGVFTYIQEFWGFISPGVVAVFAFGLFSPRTPTLAGNMALIFGPIFYGFLFAFARHIAYLNRMGITFLVVAAIMAAITLWRPLSEARVLPTSDIDLKRSPYEKVAGGTIIVVTAVLYYIFW